MYGLMKAHLCARHTEEAQQRRLHYCGTCKTMGRLYGQKARLLLNNDAIFLAELLTALSAQPQPTREWSAAYQSYNCFALPEDTAEMPLPTQIAAAVTLVMTEFKVVDRIADSAHGGWKVVGKLFSQSFVDAARQMAAWGFPVEELKCWGGRQEAREREAGEQVGAGSALELLAYVAEPTAVVTGLVFQHSAAAVSSDTQTQRTMYDLGFAFGELVYLLDALEDFSKDTQHGDFNALQTAFRIANGALPDGYRDVVVAQLYARRTHIEAALTALPLPEGQATRFIIRLRTNLAHRLDMPVLGEACVVHSPQARLSFAARWRSALSQAKMLAQRHREQHSVFSTARLALPFVFVTVLAVALVFPQQALAATSYRECRDIAFNLIFLTAAIKALTRAPLRLIPTLAPTGFPRGGVLHSDNDPSHRSSNPTHSTGGTPHSTTVVRRVRRRNPCDGCCIGCCDSCGDACCDIACWESCQCCGEGCCCTAESCDCAGGCCDCCSSCSSN
jgi:hypothetical protein